MDSVEKTGDDLAEENAALYYKYGNALIRKYRSEANVFGNALQKRDAAAAAKDDEEDDEEEEEEEGDDGDNDGNEALGSMCYLCCDSCSMRRFLISAWKLH